MVTLQASIIMTLTQGGDQSHKFDSCTPSCFREVKAHARTQVRAHVRIEFCFIV